MLHPEKKSDFYTIYNRVYIEYRGPIFWQKTNEHNKKETGLHIYILYLLVS